jgi:hypothetical protein
MAQTIKTLHCPSCGAPMQMPNPKGLAICAYCQCVHRVLPEKLFTVWSPSSLYKQKSNKKRRSQLIKEVKRLRAAQKWLDEPRRNFVSFAAIFTALLAFGSIVGTPRYNSLLLITWVLWVPIFGFTMIGLTNNYERKTQDAYLKHRIRELEQQLKDYRGKKQ